MEISRIFDILNLYRDVYQKNDVFNTKVDGKWVHYSNQDYVNYATWFSYGLLEYGLKKNDVIVSISNNRPEWNFTDMGMNQAGIIHAPVYPTISRDEYLYILNHAAPKIILISDKALLEKLKPIISESNSKPEIFTFNDIEGMHNWLEIIEMGKATAEKHSVSLEKIKESINPHEMATLIYTSGTTGNPKGVMLSHHNLLSNAASARNIHNFNHKDKTLSFLPLCHVFERMVNYHFQWEGISIYYAENMGTIADNLKEIKPELFISVPRLIERVYDRIIGVGKDLPFIKKRLFFWAVNLGLKFDYNSKNRPLYDFKLKIANALIFKNWRKALGGNVRLIIVGGAALQPRLSRVFGAAGIPVLEGYGLTESSPVIAANNSVTGEIRVGTVGPAFENVEVKIADDGEILCKGPNVMLGYYKEPELTKETIDEEGWLHTGDIGELIDGKYLRITDRKKEMFKLSSGKYIAPQVIENKFKESFFIEQLMVVGENEKFASALISPNFQYLHSWASLHKIRFRDNIELIRKPEVIACYQKEVNALNKNFGQTEYIKRFRLVPEEWTPQSGELSPTLKIKRRFIYEKYQTFLEEIYKNNNN